MAKKRDYTFKYGRNFKPFQRRLKNDIFDCKPLEIFALCKAMRWSYADLANVLGVFCGRSGSTTVRNWVFGRNQPIAAFRAKLVIIVEQARPEYLRVMEQLDLRSKLSVLHYMETIGHKRKRRYRRHIPWKTNGCYHERSDPNYNPIFDKSGQVRIEQPEEAKRAS